MADFPLRPVSLEDEPFPLSEPARERVARRRTWAEIEGESFVRGKGYEAGRRAGGFEPAPRATAVERETPWQKAQAGSINKWYDNAIKARQDRINALQRDQTIDQEQAARWASEHNDAISAL